MGIVKAVFRIIIGAVLGIGSAAALSPAFAAVMGTAPGSSTPIVIYAVVLIGALLGLFAPTIRRAFGRGFLFLGVSVFALPLSTILLSGRVSSDMMTNVAADERAMTAVGSGLAGVVLTGAAGFIGFFLGTIFLILGLVLSLGGRREVVVVERPASP